MLAFFFAIVLQLPLPSGTKAEAPVAVAPVTQTVATVQDNK